MGEAHTHGGSICQFQDNLMHCSTPQACGLDTFEKLQQQIDVEWNPSIGTTWDGYTLWSSFTYKR